MERETKGQFELQDEVDVWNLETVGDWDEPGDGTKLFEELVDSSRWGDLVGYAAMFSHSSSREIDTDLRKALLGVLRGLK